MHNDPSSPTPAASFKVETETEIEVDVEVESEIEVQRESSPFFEDEDDLPETNISPSSDVEEASVHSEHQGTGYQSRPLSPIDEETTSEIALLLTPVRQQPSLSTFINNLNNNTLCATPVNNTQCDTQDNNTQRNKPRYVITQNNFGAATLNGRFGVYRNLLGYILTITAQGRGDEAHRILQEAYNNEPEEGSAALPIPSPSRSSRFESPSTPSIVPTPAPASDKKSLFGLGFSPLRTMATPIGKLGRFLGFGGAKTQPVQKTTAAPVTKEPRTPMFHLQTRQSNTNNAGMKRQLESLIDEDEATPSSSAKRRRVTDDPALRATSPSRQNASSTPGPSITHLPDGRFIPASFRTWIPHTHIRQDRDMATVRSLEAEVFSGDRTLTDKERKFIEDTEFREACREHWRARRPMFRKKMAAATTEQPITYPTIVPTPVAGLKRGADDIRDTTEDHEPVDSEKSEKPEESESPLKRRRTEAPFTRTPRSTLPPIGYTSPTPEQPGYRHITEERGRPATNAPGSSEPSERTRGFSVAVPDGSDDEDMGETKPPSPGKTYGIPDNFYDESDSDDELEDAIITPSAAPATSSASPFTAAPAEPPATNMFSAPVDSSTANNTSAPPTTPYAHKYTPHKPSGLRAMETASSPIPPQAAAPSVPVTEITPPQSPEISPVFMNAVQDLLQNNPPEMLPADLPEFDCSELVQKVIAAYKPFLCERNGIVLSE